MFYVSSPLEDSESDEEAESEKTIRGESGTGILNAENGSEIIKFENVEEDEQKPSLVTGRLKLDVDKPPVNSYVSDSRSSEHNDQAAESSNIEKRKTSDTATKLQGNCEIENSETSSLVVTLGNKLKNSGHSDKETKTDDLNVLQQQVEHTTKKPRQLKRQKNSMLCPGDHIRSHSRSPSRSDTNNDLPKEQASSNWIHTEDNSQDNEEKNIPIADGVNHVVKEANTDDLIKTTRCNNLQDLDSSQTTESENKLKDCSDDEQSFFDAECVEKIDGEEQKLTTATDSSKQTVDSNVQPLDSEAQTAECSKEIVKQDKSGTAVKHSGDCKKEKPIAGTSFFSGVVRMTQKIQKYWWSNPETKKKPKDTNIPIKEDKSTKIQRTKSRPRLPSQGQKSGDRILAQRRPTRSKNLHSRNGDTKISLSLKNHKNEIPSINGTQAEHKSEDINGKVEDFCTDETGDQANKNEIAEEHKQVIITDSSEPEAENAAINVSDSDLQSSENDTQKAEHSREIKPEASDSSVMNSGNQDNHKTEKPIMIQTVSKRVKELRNPEKEKKANQSNSQSKVAFALNAQNEKLRRKRYFSLRRERSYRSPFATGDESINSLSKEDKKEEPPRNEVPSDVPEIDVTFAAKLVFHNHATKEFIRKEEPMLERIKQLHLSARFVHQGMEMALSNFGCLLMVDDNFVAEVRIEQSDLLDGTEDFLQAKELVFKLLQIVEVLVDRPLAVLNQYRKVLVSRLESILSHSSSDQRRSVACIQLMKILDKYSQMEGIPYYQLMQEIEREKVFNDEMKEHIERAKQLEKTVCGRFKVFAKFGYRLEDYSRVLYQRMQRMLSETVERHRNAMMEIAPNILKNQINTVSRERFMLIAKNDVKLLSDMRSILNEEMFSKPLEDMEKRWVQIIESTEPNYLQHDLQIINKVFFFLCKSLQELILEISELTGVQAANFLKRNTSGWQPIHEINWKTKGLLEKCLERQYFFVFRLLHHFSFEPTCYKRRFEYEIQLLNNSDRSYTWIIPQLVTYFFPTHPNRTDVPDETVRNRIGIPDEVYVWYCLLDDVLYNVLPKKFDLSCTGSMLKNYLKLVQEANTDQLETLRVATHNTILFIVQVIPYMSSAGDSSPIDRCILQKQMDIISSTQYRDLVNVFYSYWKFRNDVIAKIESKTPLPEMIQLKDQLLNIVSTALDKKVDNQHVVTFFRTYEEFLLNLNEVSFDWFIKDCYTVNIQAAIANKLIQAVDNKLKDKVNATYRVIDLKKFGEFCRSSDAPVEVPRHFIIDTLKQLLANVELQLNKETWKQNERLTEEDKIASTCDLLSALHQSLLFMREQAEYVSFELFYDDSVKPFTSLIENSTSRQDFSTRVRLLKELYWFFRKQNDISLDKALLLYKSLNSTIDADLLKSLYQRYLEHFEKIMQTSAGKSCYEASLLISQTTKGFSTGEKLFKTWDSEFKQKKVPQILAGLASLWSTLVSKDVSSTGKYLSPHCIQILCVFQLLSSNEVATGIDKHLAQVLTGQGKSLILALVAAVLALTGHTVDIGCYSRYLVERDRDSFNSFYDLLNIKFDITYKTLSNIMEKFINPQVNGQTMGLRDLVKNQLIEADTKRQRQLSPVDYTKTVLLIDEVDVFFTEQFYGNTYGTCTTLVIEGLDDIQVIIWNTVSEGLSEIDDIVKRVRGLIDIPKLSSFRTFVERTHSYELLTNDGQLKTYNNRKLFDENLIAMIECAILVFKNPSQYFKFKLNPSGNITFNDNGEYVTSTYVGYQNIFNYFRLKGNNFVREINGHDNYGYLKVSCGRLSYAMLPINYPLIVGVSGTLTDLNEQEKEVIGQMYAIKEISLMPSFFGSSNLKFNESTDLTIHNSNSTWKQCIFSRANQAVEKNRAVLIFFESEVEIAAFQTAYGAQLDRLNVLTENTDDKEKYINEAGVAKTVTLATRGMGRGVDYKSSVMVEKNGGVHVIQTFFSMDVKEETQIKGRTARQDNKGSYEIVLCAVKMDKSFKLLSETSYFDLAEKRKELALDANKKITEEIEKNKTIHNNTMAFLKSFFKS